MMIWQLPLMLYFRCLSISCSLSTPTQQHICMLLRYIVVTGESQAGSDGKMQRGNNSVALGAGIGAPALVILTAVIVAVLMM